MTNPATTSLLDRANLDRDSVRDEVARGLKGADDGELFLEYAQTEALMFDNGRLKQATYDTSQGFGLRAVKDDAVGYAHSSDVSLPALSRAADAVQADLRIARHERRPFGERLLDSIFAEVALAGLDEFFDGLSGAPLADRDQLHLGRVAPRNLGGPCDCGEDALSSVRGAAHRLAL